MIRRALRRGDKGREQSVKPIGAGKKSLVEIREDRFQTDEKPYALAAKREETSGTKGKNEYLGH